MITGYLVPVPIPHDCSDGFHGVFWRHPAAYLRPDIRAGISVFQLVASDEVDRAVKALRADLDSGAWHERHRALDQLPELHLGYYVVIAELDGTDAAV